MDVVIKGFKPRGIVNVPCSKSEAHRVLIMAFLLKRKFTIKNISYSDDINATIEAIEAMGAKVAKNKDSLTIMDYDRCPNKLSIDVKQSASTLRFLLPVACYLAEEVVFKGDPSLFQRPIGVYQETFANELEFQLEETRLIVKGSLESSVYKVNTNVSSQFVTGLMFLMVLNKGIKQIELVGDRVSKNYIDITKKVMKDFGVVTKEEQAIIKLEFKECEIDSYTLEGDYSQAANYLVLGAINGNISVKNLCNNSLQGDKVVLWLLEKMGAIVSFENGECRVGGKVEIPYIEIDLKNCIDLGPILFVCAAFNKGTTKFINTQRLKIKESNRVAAMESNLIIAGVDIVVTENTVVINGNPNRSGDFVFETFKDHRIAMAMSVFSVLNNGTSIIKDVECINKSYPNFVNDLFSLKI